MSLRRRHVGATLLSAALSSPSCTPALASSSSCLLRIPTSNNSNTVIHSASVRTYFGRRSAPSPSSDLSSSNTTSKFAFKPLQRLDDQQEDAPGPILKAAPAPLSRSRRRLSFQFEEPGEVDDVKLTMGGTSKGQQKQPRHELSDSEVEEALPPLEGEDDDDLAGQYTSSPHGSSSTVDTILASAANGRREVAARHEFSDRKTRRDNDDEGSDGDDGWGPSSIDDHVQRLFEAGKSPSFAEYQAKRQLTADTTILPSDPVLQIGSSRQRAKAREEAEEGDLRQLAQLVPSSSSPPTALRGSMQESSSQLGGEEPELSPEQKHLLWEDRKKRYSVLHRKILITLESHHTLMDKALLLLELHDTVIRSRMRLRADTYEDILFALKLAVPYYNPELKMKPVNSTTMLTEGWTVYRYALDSGTNPTPAMLEKMMGFLNTTRVASPDIESKAHQVMLDVDKYKLRPTAHFLNQYYHICTRNGATHVAVMKLVEAKKKHEIAPNDNDISLIMLGFRAEGRADDALRFLSNISTITVSSNLLESIVHCARESKNPMSAFTFYKSMAPAGFRPEHRILGSLLQVQELSNDYTNSLFILREVVKHRVQLIEVHINLLLVALTKVRATKEFSKLIAAMHTHGKNIYTEKLPQEYRELVREIIEAETTRRSNISSRGGKHSPDFRKVHNPNSGNNAPSLLSSNNRGGNNNLD